MGERGSLRILAITGGHRVDLDAFTGMLGGICADRGWVFAHAAQPAAQEWLSPQHRGEFDAVLCHDLPGLALRRGTAPRPIPPAPEVARRLAELLAAGQGFVFLHHALAGWPAWPEWAGVLGGRYHYAPAELRGQPWPDSGFRYAQYTARVADRRHPVCAGLDDFVLDDELYCCPVFEDDVTPLLRADAPAGPFRETYYEVLGTPNPGPAWQHPAPSDLIAWVKSAGRSPVAYIQPGDGPDTFSRPAYRRLVANALEWVSSADARAWAAEHPTDISPAGRLRQETSMDLQLTGRKALVTGASRGIGRAIATELAREGCDLALCARGAEALEAFAKELRELGRTVYVQAVDVSDEAAVTGFVQAAAQELPGLDIVVSNVSAGSVKGPDQWRVSFQSDLLAFVRLVEAALPHLEQSDAAAVVALATTSAFDTLPPTAPNSYSALKAAVLQHASALGHALAPKGIRVNTVSPGPVDFPDGDWDRLRQRRPEFYEGIQARIPIGRLGRAEEIARAVTFLASPAASFCTAVNLVVDGGFVSRVHA